MVAARADARRMALFRAFFARFGGAVFVATWRAASRFQKNASRLGWRAAARLKGRVAVGGIFALFFLRWAGESSRGLRRPRPYSRGERGVARWLPPKEVVEELGEADAEAAYPDGQADGRPLDAVHQAL